MGRTFDEFFELRRTKRCDFSEILNGETIVVVVLFERSKGLGEDEMRRHWREKFASTAPCVC